jgi:hypothetical protein
MQIETHPLKLIVGTFPYNIKLDGFELCNFLFNDWSTDGKDIPAWLTDQMSY